MALIETLVLVISNTIVSCGGKVTEKVKFGSSRALEFVTSIELPEFSEACDNTKYSMNHQCSMIMLIGAVALFDSRDSSESHEHKRDHRLMPMDGEIWHYDQRQSRNCGLLCYKDELKHE